MEEQIGYKVESEQDIKLDLPIKTSLSQDSRENEITKNLQIIQKYPARSDRPTIPATWREQLSYYRSYVSSPSKTHLICLEHVKFNRFLWHYILHVFCKSLPHTYVYLFLASYAPEYHSFLPKMVPITCGFSFAYIMAALCQITLVVDNTVRCLDYFLTGLYYKNPWNRNRNEFLISSFPFSYSTLYTIFIWLAITLCYKQLFKRYLWKIMHYVQHAMNTIYLFALIHMMMFYLVINMNLIIPPEVFTDLDYMLWKGDVDMLAESMTAPPVAHILTARSNIEINVSRDSAVIVISNAINFILRGWISYRVKRHCEYLVNAPIIITTFNQHSFYYFWPIYFASLSSLGEFCSIFFFFINFTSELIIAIITFQCLVEVIVCEWRTAARISVTSVLFLFGLVLFAFVSLNGIMVLYVYSQGIATLSEVIGIYILYPVGRLIEDITFHHGNPPNSLRTFNLLCVPVFYIIKFYTMINALFEVFKVTGKQVLLNQMKWLWLPIVSPMFIGIIYIIYRYKFRKRGKKWSELFCPVRYWGPKDYAVRQLRKLFDSRKYIGSQANIMLSRYMIGKEPKVYRLDIKYDSTSDRSTASPSEMRFVIETEKKNV